jgi:ketosteroid isomerase-like protein
MKIRQLWLAVALLAFAGAASAQTWSAEQKEIWQFEETQWKMAAAKDLSWMDTMVHPNLSYWETQQHLPQDKASLVRWNRFESAGNTVLEQELFPISITVTGNLAVVHYRYVIARENYKKERERVTGRYTDILLKDGGGWKFISWSGGDDPGK